MDLGLAGKSVVVTGASRGIGHAIARVFAEEGANLAICARDAAQLRAAADELREFGRRVHEETADVADARSLDRFLDRAYDALGSVDVLVNNVATFSMENTDAAWSEALNATLLSYVRATNKVVPWMKAAGGGAVVHNASIAGLEGGWPASYAAAKSAVISHGKTMALELARDGIRVNSVAPGSVEFPGGAWEQFKQTNRAFYDAVLATVPAGRFCRPQEVADAVVFLASPRASFITGACLVIDGGQHKGNL